MSSTGGSDDDFADLDDRHDVGVLGDVGHNLVSAAPNAVLKRLHRVEQQYERPPRTGDLLFPFDHLAAALVTD